MQHKVRESNLVFPTKLTILLTIGGFLEKKKKKRGHVTKKIDRNLESIIK